MRFVAIFVVCYRDLSFCMVCVLIDFARNSLIAHQSDEIARTPRFSDTEKETVREEVRSILANHDVRDMMSLLSVRH